ncbi:dirigent protein 18-like [Punica granatum]|uniref:Dirigent protein n=1 Tax=Punica granatum TaxID=22663 RepID=A0A6P8C6N3_PUNGR|nr:dirigent protein 18-like [Punica granatum]
MEKKAKYNICILMLSYILLFLVEPKNHSFARTLTEPAPKTVHQTTIITFLMRNVLSGASNNRPSTTKVTSQIPFPKPLGLFPPDGGIPIPLSKPDPSTPTTGQSSNTLGVPLDGFSFPTIATLQELELGTVTPIDEEMFDATSSSSTLYGSSPRVTGKGQGIYVASSEDGTSHMVAMAAYFAGSEFKDGLRFFGVHRRDASESHIAVIGGTGKYNDANGYASVKAVNGNIYLLFTVYLS